MKISVELFHIFLVKTVEENLKLKPKEFLNKFGREKPTFETEMIFHCKGGGRAGRATELALSLGFVK
jgi:thiosulfate:glutathione sulfurtransferase